MKRNAAGFTLLELIVVILILGILAAVAVPKYIDTIQSARISTLHGLSAGLNGAKNLAQAEYRLEGNSYQSTSGTITVNSQSIDVVPGYGIPTTSGITNMLEASYLNSFYPDTTTSGMITFEVKDFSGNSITNCGLAYDPSDTENPMQLPKSLTTSGC
jgi:MSHA pilin protein MshA